MICWPKFSSGDVIFRARPSSRNDAMCYDDVYRLLTWNENSAFDDCYWSIFNSWLGGWIESLPSSSCWTLSSRLRIFAFCFRVWGMAASAGCTSLLDYTSWLCWIFYMFWLPNYQTNSCCCSISSTAPYFWTDCCIFTSWISGGILRVLCSSTYASYFEFLSCYYFAASSSCILISESIIKSMSRLWCTFSCSLASSLIFFKCGCKDEYWSTAPVASTTDMLGWLSTTRCACSVFLAF